jgi:two-component system response regulator YesN
MAMELDIGNIQLSRKVKALTGYSPKDLLKFSRLNRAADQIKENSLSIKEVCFNVGYNNYNYFLRSFKEYFQVTPGEYKSEFVTGAK